MLTASTVAVLKRHRERQRVERQTVSEVWGDHDLIVTTTIGTPITPSSVKRSLRVLIDRAGVPHVSTHGLRHMAATLMLRAGTSPALVALKLGHTDIGTTVDAYGHLAVNDQRAVNAVMDAVAARVRNGSVSSTASVIQGPQR
jgi:integrase